MSLIFYHFLRLYTKRGKKYKTNKINFQLNVRKNIFEVERRQRNKKSPIGINIFICKNWNENNIFYSTFIILDRAVREKERDIEDWGIKIVCIKTFQALSSRLLLRIYFSSFSFPIMSSLTTFCEEIPLISFFDSFRKR